MRRTSLSRLIRLATLPVALAGTAACARSGTSTGLPGVFGGVDFTTLAGQWEGTFEGPVETGQIYLRINALSRDEATAQLAVQPKGALAPHGRNDVPVSRSGNQITLRLDNYKDPVCDCNVTTIFTGQVQGDQISGTFTTSGEKNASQRGTWQVHRSSASGQ
jgi:hypothetical protein